MAILIGQARPPHPRFLITIGPVWMYGRCLHLVLSSSSVRPAPVGEHHTTRYLGR